MLIVCRLVFQTNGLFQPRSGLPERGVNNIVNGLSTSSHRAVVCIGVASRLPEGPWLLYISP